MGTYGASKHALETTLDSLRQEVSYKWPIDVICLESGKVETPFIDRVSQWTQELESAKLDEVKSFFKKKNILLY
jgi:short-subunit dehydrogenase